MKIYKLHENATIPEFATKGSACFDLSACFDATTKIRTFNPHNKEIHIPVKDIRGRLGVQVQPQFRTLIPTGLIFNIPSNYMMDVHVRSSIALKMGLTLANNVGKIDSDYVDETFVMLYHMGDSPVTLFHGDRIAQAMLVKTNTYSLEETRRRPSVKSERNGGLGSTGLNDEDQDQDQDDDDAPTEN